MTDTTPDEYTLDSLVATLTMLDLPPMAWDGGALKQHETEKWLMIRLFSEPAPSGRHIRVDLKLNPFGVREIEARVPFSISRKWHDPAMVTDHMHILHGKHEYHEDRPTDTRVYTHWLDNNVLIEPLARAGRAHITPAGFLWTFSFVSDWITDLKRRVDLEQADVLFGRRK